MSGWTLASFLMAAALVGCGGRAIVALPQGVRAVKRGTQAARDGRTWQTAFRHPQDAVDVAAPGEEVWVAEGTYTRRRPGDTFVLKMKDGVAIYGGFAGTGARFDDRDSVAHTATLDGETTCVHVVIGASNATLDGFTVRGGNANGKGGGVDARGGGGMYNSDVKGLVVANCRFTENSAGHLGGGMRNQDSALKIVSCEFTGNSADDIGYGGAIYTQGCSLEVRDCRFVKNSAYGCGGMNTQVSTMKVTGCLFARNCGGGMYNALLTGSSVADCVFEENQGRGMSNMQCSLSVTNCRFVGNRGSRGAGMSNYESSPTVSRCTFTGNSSTGNGGGMQNHGSRPEIENCVFACNSAVARGGAVYNCSVSAPRITSCALVGNSSERGGAVWSSRSAPVLRNCVVWGNSAGVEGAEIHDDADSSTTATCSCIQGGWPGEGNIGEDPVAHDPLFVDPAGGDLHLSASSPCINAGDPATTLTEDIEGNPRPAGSGYDMGAYEFQP